VPINEQQSIQHTWQFFIDRGGTFTDVIGVRDDGSKRVHKLLSVNSRHYADAAVQGIRDILELGVDEKLQAGLIKQVRLGTTVATNALLERKGEPTVLVVNTGYRDALQIAYQNRPDIFARNIILPEPLYASTIEISGRISAHGVELEPFDETAARERLKAALEAGITSCAIVFMHSYLFPFHEQRCAEIASEVGFNHVTMSHITSPLIKLVIRGDTTVADAYLSPILHRYLDKFSKPLLSTRIYFMQSNGGLTDRKHFRGKDSLLSGPAGGVVGAVETAKALGFEKIVSFDMGGTSTDVSHFDGYYERQDLTTIGGIRIRAPMIAVHTIAAGGGSVLQFDGHRLLVGPESAGSDPGPSSYGNGGPLTITDANLLLGRIQSDFFPKVFGEDGQQPLDIESVAEKFLDLKSEIAKTIEINRTEEIAWGFIEIAVEKMARAIKKITIERGYEIKDAVLNSFGGAGGQHACLIAENLGMDTVMIDKFAGVLSALGIGLSSIKVVQDHPVQKDLNELTPEFLIDAFSKLCSRADEKISDQGGGNGPHQFKRLVMLRYNGSDTTIAIELDSHDVMSQQFHESHLQRFGFHSLERKLIVESLSLETIAAAETNAATIPAAPSTDEPKTSESTILDIVKFYSKGSWWVDTPVIARESLKGSIEGPAIILDNTSTNLVEPGWIASLAHNDSLILTRIRDANHVSTSSAVKAAPAAFPIFENIETSKEPQKKNTQADPILLELFNNKFMAIAEEMGVTLCHTSRSVNIKERLDFSCALFDQHGKLIANAPHMPVHLGSMGESVRAIIDTFQTEMKNGDVYFLNNPYSGGTHLPDITVVTPVFASEIPARPAHKTEAGTSCGSTAPSQSTIQTPSQTPKLATSAETPSPAQTQTQSTSAQTQKPPQRQTPIFYTASRGHHADIGGITAGSMPPNSRSIEEEGALIDPTLLVSNGVFDEQKVYALLTKCRYPTRNIEQNISDLQAQIAANNRGVLSLLNLIESYGLDTVYSYMHHVRQNAEDCVREAIGKLSDGAFELAMDSGAKICVNVKVDKINRSATIDFTGTSEQQNSNLNAPRAITIAAVLYVFRTLVDANIPLNDGCLAPLNIIVPTNSMLNPCPPAAVVAGNVETSQAIVDAVYGALKVMAASQGTMNNFTFGNATHQYYETVCGGAGAGPDHKGCDAVQTHMTNSRLTDPEVLEWRFPVILKEFSIRKGSGGLGKYNGGNGVTRKVQFTETMEASILSQRRKVVPFGMDGGSSAATGRNYVIKKLDGKIIELSGTDTLMMNPGDTFVIETPGGGAWGQASSPQIENDQK
jgi:5-oxoprolinase (ATP-hydrolysing)